jgi:uridine phosphorylase
VDEPVRRDHQQATVSAPILDDKHYRAPSSFTPENLLRDARRQKGIGVGGVPEVCILDPDGDIVRYLRASGRTRRSHAWACYHTDLWGFDLDGREVGIVGCAVGASFAVLVAEEFFASGGQLLISMTSAGQLAPLHPPPYFVLIDRALRDEGTSYHYLPPAEFSGADPALLEQLARSFEDLSEPVWTGATWTTDAPFRETAAAIQAMEGRGLLAVEMEAAALYAFAEARRRRVVCFAHVTNQMGREEGDFEKGEADGAVAALALITRASRVLLSREPAQE